MELDSSSPGGLYALVDFDTCIGQDLDPLRVVQSVCAASVPLLQLRAKALADREYLDWVRASLQSVKAKTKLLVNDRADLALLTGAAGVHLGQDDVPAQSIKGVRPELVVGLSTHDLGQVQEAVDMKLDYVAFGPVFPTLTKKNPEPVTGLSALEHAHEITRSVEVPLVAIGGVTEEVLSDVAAHCEYVAAIRLLLPSRGQEHRYEWITRRCEDLNERIQEAQRLASSS